MDIQPDQRMFLRAMKAKFIQEYQVEPTLIFASRVNKVESSICRGLQKVFKNLFGDDPDKVIYNANSIRKFWERLWTVIKGTVSEVLKNERHQKLYNIIYRSYLESTEIDKYVPTSMYGDNCDYTQMAVVAVDTIKKGKQIEDFTAVMWENDLTPEMEFLVFKVQNNSKKAKIMLGAASFVNHDCYHNCR